MAEFGRNTALKLLRELGVDDKDLKKLRELIRYYNEKDLYTNIANRNYEALEERTRPMTLSYNSVLAILSEETETNVGDIISAYSDNIASYESGSTTNIDSFVERYTNELQDYGVIVNNNQVRFLLMEDKKTFNTLDKYKKEYEKYKELGDERQCEYYRELMQQLIDSVV